MQYVTYGIIMNIIIPNKSQMMEENAKQGTHIHMYAHIANEQF